MDETVRPADAVQTEAAPVADTTLAGNLVAMPGSEQGTARATYTDSEGATHDADVLAEGRGYASLNIKWNDGSFSQAASVPLDPDGKPGTYKVNEA